ncbi:acyltransferase domain-containing protein [Streptomyces ficellus]|uniref:Acyltransferase domain-containing protein n=1 Tax=Streptomyces ficellus TaxID=1977088 RepID=A0A6I6F433_9ACTN|nr:acyltransferase domain-containing protein [Streptomyces ficellus]QGV77484.1 acyltransferase domain-containing protein [Streptomyces ficellus]
MPAQEPDRLGGAHREWLLERLGHYLGRPVDDSVPLSEYGLDSVAALSLYGDIEEEFGPLIDLDDIRAYPTVRELARHMAVRDVRRPGAHRARAAFVFTGQGCQYPGMTSALYLDSAAYRGHLDEMAEALHPYLGLSVVDLILSEDPRIHLTAFTQPALFAVEYALARTLETSGVVPVAVLGHGIGEFAAATVAGALNPADAAKLIAMRGAFMQYLPSGGGMMAACVSPYEIAELVVAEPGVGISAVNAARATVLSGEVAGLERIEAELATRGIKCRHLPVGHAFNSPLMEPVVPKFEAVARRIPAGTPRVPFYSTVLGRLATEPLYASYWTEQLTSPIRFADAARGMLGQQTPTHVVEIGPRPVLGPYLRRMGGPACIPMCPRPDSDAVDLAGVISALGAGPLAAELAGA